MAGAQRATATRRASPLAVFRPCGNAWQPAGFLRIDVRIHILLQGSPGREPAPHLARAPLGGKTGETESLQCAGSEPNRLHPPWQKVNIFCYPNITWHFAEAKVRRGKGRGHQKGFDIFGPIPDIEPRFFGVCSNEWLPGVKPGGFLLAEFYEEPDD
jgi:hypothetical protein